MWGTLAQTIFPPMDVRFIPTYVGNAALREHLATHVTVHPHVCGERYQLLLQHWTLDGSSPRMWGTREAIKGNTVLFRFIPTYVGNAIADNLYFVQHAVHPHVCGERLYLFV